jgi:hypothetical protein
MLSAVVTYTHVNKARLHANSVFVHVLSTGFSSRMPKTSIGDYLEQKGFGAKNLKSDGHLITEDSVFPTTAPGGAPKRNRCYQDARYFI